MRHRAVKSNQVDFGSHEQHAADARISVNPRKFGHRFAYYREVLPATADMTFAVVEPLANASRRARAKLSSPIKHRPAAGTNVTVRRSNENHNFSVHRRSVIVC